MVEGAGLGHYNKTTKKERKRICCHQNFKEKCPLKETYENSFLTREQTDNAWHLILARIETREALQDNKAPKTGSYHFCRLQLQIFCANLCTRLLR